MAEKCGSCEDVVTDLGGLCCDRCDKWFHPTCQAVKKTSYRFFASSSQPWLCSPCLQAFKGDFVKAAKVDLLEQEITGLRQRLAGFLLKEKAESQKKDEACVDRADTPIEGVSRLPATGASCSLAPAPVVRAISYAAVASAPRSGSPVVKSKSSLAMGIEGRIKGIRREVDREGGSNRELGWQVARSKARTVRKDRPRVLVDIPVDNRFRVLEEDSSRDGDSVVRSELPLPSSPELVVIGDSQVRHIGSNLRRKSRVACFPGAGVVSREGKVGLEQSLPEIPFDSSSSVAINIGGNDIGRVGSEGIYRAYERVLRDADRRASNVLVIGILPRPSRAAYWSSVAIGLNVRLSALCDRLGLRFVDVWDSFQGRGDLYAFDGVHLNFKGYRVFGRVVDEELDRIEVLMRQGNF